MKRSRSVWKIPEGSLCQVEGCEGEQKSRSYCLKHYTRLLSHGSVEDRPHHLQVYIDDQCVIIEDDDERCKNKRLSGGFCGTHYKRYQRYGNPLVKREIKGEAKYRVIKAHGHPNARANGDILEHRLVMSQHIGRPLYEHENIHHINGDGFDNRIENLELWSKSQPAGQRIEDKVNWAVELLEQYAPEKLRK